MTFIEDWTPYKFPKHFKPLPPGYEVIWTGTHFYWKNDKDEEGNICWDRFQVRRWAFQHFSKHAIKDRGEALKESE